MNNTQIKKETNLKKDGFKPVAVQNECWGGGKDDPILYVLIKWFKPGKKNPIFRFSCRAFVDADYLNEFIKENNCEILPEKDFRATKSAKILHLISAV